MSVDPGGVFHVLAGVASGQPGLCTLQISENHCGFGFMVGFDLNVDGSSGQVAPY